MASHWQVVSCCRAEQGSKPWHPSGSQNYGIPSEQRKLAHGIQGIQDIQGIQGVQGI